MKDNNSNGLVNTTEQEEMRLAQCMYLGYPVLTFNDWLKEYWESDHQSDYGDHEWEAMSDGERHEAQYDTYQVWLDVVIANPQDWRNN